MTLHFRKPFHLLFFFSVLLIFDVPPVTSQFPLHATCNKTANYTDTSTFSDNLRRLLNFLSISNLDNSFYNGSVGSGDDRIYGIVWCNSDAEAVCTSCVKNASEEILRQCPNNKGATLWYKGCVLRYSNIFSSSWKESIDIWNMQNVSDPDNFKRVLGNLMRNLTNTAAFQPQSGMLARGHARYLTSENVYGAVQCMRDMSANDCYGCLSDAVSVLPSCCESRRGARILADICNLRYEFYKFYNGSDIEVQYPAADAVPPSATNTSRPDGRRTGKKDISSRITAILVSTIVVAVILCIFFSLCLLRKTCLQRKKNNTTTTDVIEVVDKSYLVKFDRIRAVTNDFSEENKLGEGGFGPVYKASLPCGQEIAVKRLSVNSGQGAQEFRNEVALIAKLHHKNLVRLFGCCIEGEEKLLIYEYIPNGSLDYFLFDPTKRASLNWECRYKIIGGVARGLLYLHEESQLKIIHRDLKSSNILLDANMNPKISDFGMAKIFQVDETQRNTSRIAGTYGYMSPEYVINGHLSVKLDVFSFGVLLLEIVSGQRNNTFYQTNLAEDLLSYVWRAWTNGTALDIIDSTLSRHFPRSKAMRCIHIGLLCVQNDPAARPSMSSVVVMVNSLSITLPSPSPPAFFVSCVMEPNIQIDHSSMENKLDQPLERSIAMSVNGTSITELEPR